jgi:hypothetical protein
VKNFTVKTGGGLEVRFTLACHTMTRLLSDRRLHQAVLGDSKAAPGAFSHAICTIWFDRDLVASSGSDELATMSLARARPGGPIRCTMGLSPIFPLLGHDEQVSILIHELVHLVQLLEGRLWYQKDGIYWKGKDGWSCWPYRKKISYTVWSSFPWEQEAMLLQNFYAPQFGYREKEIPKPRKLKHAKAQRPALKF